ncbi:MAG: hypothetical protein OZSIB_0371 [Candidatus Ozemobacter sibiricus]|jgi:hypothetical protein|uniref:Phosphatidylglycerol lysyltransferase C-terminal domain-containing protein n=1 Tax=Candidatus Ozemobacter sibiricus TaxID=2268124 RepID=A0A367ZMP3_9BACT|nr:MAG: hypothetical protein OZSIB_0371 [Candidatus Ozemobacter sibiricus]
MNALPTFPASVPLGFEHQPLIAGLLARKGIHSSDFAFYNLWGWYLEKPTQISRFGDHLILVVEGPGGACLALPPLGEGPIRGALEALLAQMAVRGCPLTLSYVPTIIKEEIVAAVPGCRCEPQRSDFDYLYDRTELAELAGRKFHQKKNFVNRVQDELRPVVERMTPAHADEVQAYLDQWYAAFPATDETVKIEALAARRALPHLDRMGGLGILVRVDGRLAGVSFASPVHPGCWVVTLEKAERSYKGLYQFLNWALVNRLPPDVTLINRETDLGIEGLRTAKLSYHPCGFEEKFTIWF